jgi:hypothetical protein
MLFGGFFGGFKTPNSTFRVHLKPFTTHSDTLEILKMPFLQGVIPTTIYDQGKNRGFIARLSDEQLCNTYKLPVVCPTRCGCNKRRANMYRLTPYQCAPFLVEHPNFLF